MAEEPAGPIRPTSTATLSAEPNLDIPTPRRVWGAWASVGWTVLISLAMLATQAVAAIGYAVARMPANPKADLSNLVNDGTLMAVATLLSLPVVLGLVALLISVRGWRVGDYLALRPASRRATVLAISGLIIWLASSDGLTLALKRPIVPPVMVEAITTAPLWLIALAVVVGAPTVEEVLFRGFFYRGLTESRLGPGMAIGITATAWAAMHIQYDLYGVATVYLMGLYLGLIRHLSGSLSLTILLHGLANAVATAEAVLFPG